MCNCRHRGRHPSEVKKDAVVRRAPAVPVSVYVNQTCPLTLVSLKPALHIAGTASRLLQFRRLLETFIVGI